MLESILNKEDTKEKKNLNTSSKFAVMKLNGDVIKSFQHLSDAHMFSEKANKTYKEHGLICTTIVINSELLG